MTPADACLHCALSRALEAVDPLLSPRGLRVTVGAFEPLQLPVSGARLYRALRHLLMEAADHAERGPIRVAVLDLPGKSAVEVTATVRQGRRARVSWRAFSRHVDGTLERGFAEGTVGPR